MNTKEKSSCNTKKPLHLLLSVVLCLQTAPFGGVEGFQRRHHPLPSRIPQFTGEIGDSSLQRFTSHHPSSSRTSLCGIKGFRAWFEDKYPEAITELENTGTSQDNFDHVLVDMNQVLHIVMRRSRRREQALSILMSELDRLIQVATPTKTLVLALDGPPSAAKLATQRKRRYSTYIRINWKLDHFEKLRLSKRDRQRRRRSFERELRSIEITPATDFMKSMESALVYWAWQRLMSRNSKLKDVDVYISSSSVPGEGEVKLMDWVWEHGPFNPHRNATSDSRRRKLKPKVRNESICFIGDDSDLLLEGMVIPPSFAHNVFVVRQQRPNHFCVSLWETTRALAESLPSNSLTTPIDKMRQILQARTDFVLLMMMNGNDYLPRLRGSRGFSKLLKTYMKVLRADPTSGLIHANSLELQLDFCIAFFKEIAKLNPPNSMGESGADADDDNDAEDDESQHFRVRKTPLAELNAMTDSGFLPRPIKFHIMSDTTLATRMNEASSDQYDSTVNGQNYIESALDDSEVDRNDKIDELPQRHLRMTLGDPDSDSYLEYDSWHNHDEPIKLVKQHLAAMALDAFLGTDFAGGTETFDSYGGITSSGYAWEIAQAVEGKVDQYLGGLIWNLQTYQDGICADYGYNYGRCMSPTAQEIVDFLMEAKAEGRSVGKIDLLGDNDEAFREPISAGLSCLAALPSQVKSVVPSPYRDLPDDIVETFYEQCMDPIDNVFDMKKFEVLCEENLSKMDQLDDDSEKAEKFENSNVLMDTHSWTVLSKTKNSLKFPFKPPAPPSKKFSPLFQSKCIKMSQYNATSIPRARSSWGYGVKELSHPYGEPILKESDPDIAGFLGDADSIFAIGYKDGYQARKRRNKKTARNPKQRTLSANVAARMKAHNIEGIPNKVPSDMNNQTSLGILKALGDIGMIGLLKFDMTTPSPSNFASFDPESFELTRLTVQASDHKNSVLKNHFSLSVDREKSTYTRKVVKHQLGSKALHRLTGAQLDWSKSSFEEVKHHLMDIAGLNIIESGTDSKDWKVPISSADGSTAVECLKQLRDIGMIGKTRFIAIPTNDTPKSETMQLIVKCAQDKSKGILKKNLSYKQIRQLQGQTKRSVKQYLASLALTDIVGSEIKWNNMTFSELRELLMTKSQATKFSPPSSKGRRKHHTVSE